MEIGKPVSFYPFRKHLGGLVYLPYNGTDLDVAFVGNREEYLEIVNFLKKIGEPIYKEDSVKNNMLSLYKHLKYWPEPMISKKVILVLKPRYKYAD